MNEGYRRRRRRGPVRRLILDLEQCETFEEFGKLREQVVQAKVTGRMDSWQPEVRSRLLHALDAAQERMNQASR